MKKHDETIQHLFDDYAETLTPRNDLAEKARLEMVANKQAQPSASARKSSSGWIHLAWITPVAAVFIAIVVIIFSSPLFAGIGDRLGDNDTPPQPAVAYYTYADVKGKSVSLDYCDYMLQINKLTANGYEIVGQRCYAFFTDDGELRYVKAYLGLRSADGTFTEITLIAEVDGYVREDLQDIYDSNNSHEGLSVDSSTDTNGEYVTRGYFAARNLHFYVVARNGQRTDVAQDIMKIISER